MSSMTWDRWVELTKSAKQDAGVAGPASPAVSPAVITIDDSPRQAQPFPHSQFPQNVTHPPVDVSTPIALPADSGVLYPTDPVPHHSLNHQMVNTSRQHGPAVPSMPWHMAASHQVAMYDPRDHGPPPPLPLPLPLPPPNLVEFYPEAVSRRPNSAYYPWENFQGVPTPEWTKPTPTGYPPPMPWMKPPNQPWDNSGATSHRTGWNESTQTVEKKKKKKGKKNKARHTKEGFPNRTQLENQTIAPKKRKDPEYPSSSPNSPIGKSRKSKQEDMPVRSSIQYPHSLYEDPPQSAINSVPVKQDSQLSIDYPAGPVTTTHTVKDSAMANMASLREKLKKRGLGRKQRSPLDCSSNGIPVTPFNGMSTALGGPTTEPMEVETDETETAAPELLEEAPEFRQRSLMGVVKTPVDEVDIDRASSCAILANDDKSNLATQSGHRFDGSSELDEGEIDSEVEPPASIEQSIDEGEVRDTDIDSGQVEVNKSRREMLEEGSQTGPSTDPSLSIHSACNRFPASNTAVEPSLVESFAGDHDPPAYSASEAEAANRATSGNREVTDADRNKGTGNRSLSSPLNSSGQGPSEARQGPAKGIPTNYDTNSNSASAAPSAVAVPDQINTQKNGKGPQNPRAQTRNYFDDGSEALIIRIDSDDEEMTPATEKREGNNRSAASIAADIAHLRRKIEDFERKKKAGKAKTTGSDPDQMVMALETERSVASTPSRKRSGSSQTGASLAPTSRVHERPAPCDTHNMLRDTDYPDTDASSPCVRQPDIERDLSSSQPGHDLSVTVPLEQLRSRYTEQLEGIAASKAELREEMLRLDGEERSLRINLDSLESMRLKLNTGREDPVAQPVRDTAKTNDAVDQSGWESGLYTIAVEEVDQETKVPFVLQPSGYSPQESCPNVPWSSWTPSPLMALKSYRLRKNLYPHLIRLRSGQWSHKLLVTKALCPFELHEIEADLVNYFPGVSVASVRERLATTHGIEECLSAIVADITATADPDSLPLAVDRRV